ncbi:WD40-repeat-containing domain protein [Polychytrium aggregatum]|uniref:WD40-repeat-containing domain protein n=1 Tax=Polychytrium aggregatum TaxID=110093 RepID=UPI0022FE8C16|nr:WD40-repeat-containing domain protein [Polychytrium aggregatum]KAI9204380.1 WD40-repeat-containing domain protein [Polychytrium aggregatum]
MSRHNNHNGRHYPDKRGSHPAKRPRVQTRPSEDTSSQPLQTHGAGSAASASSSSSSAIPGMPQIPGYYYDPEKKRFFKSLPTALAVAPQACASLAKSEASRNADAEQAQRIERIRQKNREHGLLSRLSPGYSYAGLVHLMSDRESGIQTGPFAGHIQEVSMKRLRHRAILPRVAALPPHRSSSITDIALHPYRTHLCVGYANGDLSISSLKIREDGNIDENCLNKAYRQGSSRITSLRYLPFQDQSIVIATDLGGSQSPGTAVVYSCSLSCEEAAGIVAPGPRLLHRFTPSKGSLFACATNSVNREIFAVGGSGRAYVIRGWTVSSPHPVSLFVKKSDVLAQSFDETGNLLCSGCRSGNIFWHDLRGRIDQSANAMSDMGHDSAICHLEVVGPTGLYSSAMNGSIKQWDVRWTRSPVLEFQGNVNSHTKQNFELDDSGSTLVSVGQDKHLRIWSTRTGQLLAQKSTGVDSSSPDGAVVRMLPPRADRSIANIWQGSWDAGWDSSGWERTRRAGPVALLACGNDVNVWGC